MILGVGVVGVLIGLALILLGAGLPGAFLLGAHVYRAGQEGRDPFRMRPRPAVVRVPEEER